jgi:hypothetical protein
MRQPLGMVRHRVDRRSQLDGQWQLQPAHVRRLEFVRRHLDRAQVRHPDQPEAAQHPQPPHNHPLQPAQNYRLRTRNSKRNKQSL